MSYVCGSCVYISSMLTENYVSYRKIIAILIHDAVVTQKYLNDDSDSAGSSGDPIGFAVPHCIDLYID